MEKFIIGFFGFLKSCVQFLGILAVACILLLLLYWIQNLTGAHWDWIGFIAPFFDSLLDYTNSIYSLSFDFFGAKFELKYLSTLIILIIVALSTKLLTFILNIIEGSVKMFYFASKKAEEFVMNKKLEKHQIDTQKKLVTYSVAIKTQLKKKFSHPELNVSIEEQNKLMNEFIVSKTGVKPNIYNGSYVYYFTNFDKIDSVLDILFKLLHSNTPLKYAITIQVGHNLEQFNQLINMENYDKIVMAADTAYRYRFNETHRYQTTQMGIYQKNQGTIELHEFLEIL